MSECADTGLGYKWAGSALGDLQHHHPSTGDKCEHFQVGLHNRLLPRDGQTKSTWGNNCFQKQHQEAGAACFNGVDTIRSCDFCNETCSPPKQTPEPSEHCGFVLFAGVCEAGPSHGRALLADRHLPTGHQHCVEQGGLFCSDPEQPHAQARQAQRCRRLHVRILLLNSRVAQF